MEHKGTNLHPIYDQLLTRADREESLHQRSKVFWMTGLSGSGKSTIAAGLEKQLMSAGYLCMVLDGDNIRNGINKDLTFTEVDRTENIRRIAEIAKLFVDAGVIVLSSFVSPTNVIRNQARAIIGAEDFNEIFIDTPLEVCEARDVKGLYQKARAGEIKNFTGIDAPFEQPEDPFLVVKTVDTSIEESVAYVFDNIKEKIQYEL